MTPSLKIWNGGAATTLVQLLICVLWSGAAVSANACTRKGPSMNDSPPVLVTGKVFWEKKHERPEEERAVYELTKILSSLIVMVDRKDFSGLPDYVSRKKGLYVDLKAHRTHDQLLKEIEKTDGYLQNFFFNTDALRKQTGNPERLAVRDILRTTKKLRVDFYMENGERECELKLFLEDNPDASYMLNNPVFIREGEHWKVYRLF